MMNAIKTFFSSGGERSVRTKRNIAVSVVVRGSAMALGLILVPLALRTVSIAEYGIWLTIASFIGWFSFFDIGLGNGLRNKLAEAFAKNDRALAREYVSTTYAVMGIIAGALLVVFLAVHWYVPWDRFFNVPPDIAGDVALLIPIVFLLFMIQFVAQLIVTVLLADQRPALTTVIGLLGSVLTVIGIFFVERWNAGSVFSLGLVFMASPVIVLSFFHGVLYATRYRDISPVFRAVRFDLARVLTTLGGQFFVIQIAVVVLFSTSNMIIIHYFGPAEVTAYNIAFKYFNIVTALFVLVATPFWSAITDAYHQGDDPWIRRSIKKLTMVWGGVSAGAVVMLILSPVMYRLWVGEAVTVSFEISAWMCLLVILSNWNSIYAMFLNGTGKIRLQLYSAIAVSIVNIPLSIGLLSLFGISGVIISGVICVGAGSVWAPIQYHKIMNKTATGMWAQ